jgi:hypothetical protein
VDQRAAWGTAGGVVTATTGTNAAAWAVGATASGSHLPLWPAYVFGAMAVVGLYVVVAVLLGWWPLNRLPLAPAELLDDCIRSGQTVRERITYEAMDNWGATRLAVAWCLGVGVRLRAHFPALADEFQSAAPPDPVSTKESLVPYLNTKISVLAEARKGLAG